MAPIASEPLHQALIKHLSKKPAFAPIGVFKGINIITLYYRDPDGKAMPINYRIYDKQEEKTKNNYFREMVEEVIEWGIKPLLVTGDTRGSQLRKSEVY